MTPGNLTTHFLDRDLTYTGVELRPHYLLSKHRIEGSALMAFVGDCDVKTEHLVDWEDRLNSDHIRAEKMVHFLGEFFQSTLREGILRQRLLMSLIHDVLQEKLPNAVIRRNGDDLFFYEPGGTATTQNEAGFKLSVSIVTSSPVSQLLHAAINLDSKGAPVKATGLWAMGLKDLEWVNIVLTRFAEEWKSIEYACTKVRPVI